MTTSIEGFPDPQESVPTPQEAHFDPEEQAKLDEIDALMPTGDAVADGKKWDEFLNNGRFSPNFDTPEQTLRVLLGTREALDRVAAETTDADHHLYRTTLRAKELAALNRILDHYGANE